MKIVIEFKRTRKFGNTRELRQLPSAKMGRISLNHLLHPDAYQLLSIIGYERAQIGHKGGGY